MRYYRRSSQPVNEIRVGRPIASASQKMRQLENERGQAEGCIRRLQEGTPSNAYWGMNARPTHVIPTCGYRNLNCAPCSIPRRQASNRYHRTTPRIDSPLSEYRHLVGTVNTSLGIFCIAMIIATGLGSDIRSPLGSWRFLLPAPSRARHAHS